MRSGGLLWAFFISLPVNSDVGWSDFLHIIRWPGVLNFNQMLLWLSAMAKVVDPRVRTRCPRGQQRFAHYPTPVPNA